MWPKLWRRVIGVCWCLNDVILTAKSPEELAVEVLETNRSSMPNTVSYVGIGSTHQSCVILRLIGTGFRIQSYCLCLPHQASYDSEQGMGVGGSPLMYSNEEGSNDGTK